MKWKGIINIAAEGREATALNNRDTSQDPIDKIISHFKFLKAKSQKIEKDEFYGYVLFAHLITIESFVKLYDEDSSFYKEVMNAADVTKPKPGTHIIQYRIHVPEITGMLPFPDMTNFFKAEVIEDEASFLDGGTPQEQKKADDGFKKVQELKKAFYPEVFKLDLFPKMYRYAGAMTDSPSSFPGQFCKIKIPKSFPTMGVGIVLEVFDETVDVIGVKNINEPENVPPPPVSA